MKRIKKILIGIFFSLLLIPILTNNVYAETVSLSPWTFYDLSDVKAIHVGISRDTAHGYYISGGGYQVIARGCTVSIVDDLGNTVLTKTWDAYDSGRLNATSQIGEHLALVERNTTLAFDTRSLSGNYKIVYSDFGLNQLNEQNGSGLKQNYCYITGVSITGVKEDKPSFQPNSYVQSNGNLTHINS